MIGCFTQHFCFLPNKELLLDFQETIVWKIAIYRIALSKWSWCFPLFLANEMKGNLLQ